MSVCPGCGRCRQCGQPAPIQPQPRWWYQPTFTSPNTTPPWNTPYYTGDPIPGAPGTITVTCSGGGGIY